MSFVGFGVVVITVCGFAPRRNPNSACSQQASGYFQPAISSHQSGTDQIHDGELLRPTPDLLGAHARLSESTTSQNEPVDPIARRSELGRSSPEFPVVQLSLI